LYSTGISPWNSPQFVVASRFKNPSSWPLEGLCLPFSPFPSLSRAVFGSSVPSRDFSLSKEMQALRSLLAHLLRLSPASPAKIPCPCSTKASSLRSSRKLTHPSACFKTRNPSSHHCWRLKDVGLSLRSTPPQGLATLSGSLFLVPRKPLSAPNALGFLPSELLSTSESKKGLSPLFFHPCTFTQNLPGLESALRQFLPQK